MRQVVIIFFILLFGAFIATPTFVAFSENSIDLSYIHSSTEEEKTNSERIIDEIENKQINKIYYYNSNLTGLHTKHPLAVPDHNWSTIYFEINSPPPDIS